MAIMTTGTTQRLRYDLESSYPYKDLDDIGEMIMYQSGEHGVRMWSIRY